MGELLQIRDADDADGVGLQVFKPGQSFRFAATTTVASVLVDPTPAPVMTLRGPDGTTITPTVAHDSTGEWHADGIVPTSAAAGFWVRRWQCSSSTPSDAATVEIRFKVAALDF